MVNQFGGPGSKQEGIDIEARGDFGVYSFQCKQVKGFGPGDVDAAVAAHTFVSHRKHILLSRNASTGARTAIAKHPGWELWDQEDISSKFRGLPMVDRRKLVDIFFRHQRQALLGVPESGPFQTAEAFFKQYLKPSGFFNHCWQLVGREIELEQLTTSLLDDNVLVTMLQGAPGSGKSRLLRAVVETVRRQRPDLAVCFVSSPTEEIKAHHLEELGTGAKLLIVDDAHDRDDLAQLLRYVSVADNRGRLLLSLRSYGRARVEQQAACAAIDSCQINIIDLPSWSRGNALALARMVLDASGGPVQAASAIAELTHLTPLMTVLAAQVVAKEKRPLALIGNSRDSHNYLLARYEKIMMGEILPDPQDKPKLQALLRMVALLQPVAPNDRNFLDILLAVEKLTQEDTQRLLQRMGEVGVLFRRGLLYRLAPDLLADVIIKRDFFVTNGSVTDKVEEVFDIAEGDYLKHLLVNLGRLDWRRREGNTEGSMLLARIAPKLRWHNDYHNPHIQAVAAVAYYQPRLALDFAERLIKQQHGNVPGVCEMVRNAVYNPEYLEEGCVLLWRAGKDDARVLHQCPEHGIRILQELAEFAPQKPVECVERVVNFAISLLDRPISLRGCYTPFTILEGALRTNMEERTYKNRTVTFSRYQLPYELAKGVRARVMDTIINAIQGDDPRKGFLAAQLLEEALDSPIHGPYDTQAWNAAHAELLGRVHTALVNPAMHPVVLMEAARSVSWHAFYNPNSECSSLAQSILALLDRDLPTRLIRFMADAYGQDTWEDDDSHMMTAYTADAARFLESLSIEFPDAEQLHGFLEKWLNEIKAVAGQGWGTPDVMIHRLLPNRPDLAEAILSRCFDAQSPLSDFAGISLGVLFAPQERQERIAKLLQFDPVKAWPLVAAAYMQTEQFTDDDMPNLQHIFQSKDPAILLKAPWIARNIAKQKPALAVELICLADMTIESRITHDSFLCLVNREMIPEEVIQIEQWQTLVNRLTPLPDLEDHWVFAFLKRAVAVVPADVIEMLKRRLQQGAFHFMSRAMEEDCRDKSLELLSHLDGLRLLKAFLAWAVYARNDRGRPMEIGPSVSALCGEYSPELLELLLELLKGGTLSHAHVVASVLRVVHQKFVIDKTDFVRKVLDQAELIDWQAVDDVIQALTASALDRARFREIGKPFQEDVALQEHAQDILPRLNRSEPAYRLYKSIGDKAKRKIEHTSRNDLAMEEDEDV
ncbi:hypothetical protein SIID45300_03076 [Candidatus Magnetaquicoccaceae bacterium FCR-1]|uniref:Restriction endonuclease type IV Mrr domain-containing protein n=1 Tax=Candidatus Magnetaquiglobus chichijimensis TaxID=3141448 RepID=A0ABQ0CCV1_9PROT